jgi:catechol 2,3-dioxygenase-like lactoylglutathione lyase family enzyme
MIRGLHHVSMTTPDIRRLKKYYVEMLGFEVVLEGVWEKDNNADTIMGTKDSSGDYAFLRLGNCFLEVFQFAKPDASVVKPLSPNDRGYTHLCLDVDDVDKEYARLKAAGVAFNSAPVESPISKCVYSRDPDGNIIELLQFTADVPFHSEHLRRLTDVRKAAE